MALATQCPHCHTTFRVAADQLKLRGGIVRCGACQSIFDGNAHLIDLERQAVPPAPSPAPSPTPAAPAPDFASQPVYTLDFGHTFDPLGILPKAEMPVAEEPADDPADAPAPATARAQVWRTGEARAPVAPEREEDARAAPADDAIDASVDEDAPPAVPDEAAETDVAPPAGDDIDAPAAEDTPPDDATGDDTAPADAASLAVDVAEPPASAYAPADRIEPTFDLPVDEELVAHALPDFDVEPDPQPESPPAPALPAPGVDADAIPPTVLPLRASSDDGVEAVPTVLPPTVGTPKSARAKAADARARRSKLTPTKIEPPRLRMPVDADADEPEFVKRSRRQEQSSKLRRWLFGGGSAVLALALLAQGVVGFRNVLAAQNPALKPALQAACTLLGCRVELPVQVENLAIETGELTTLGPDTYALATLLRNQGNLVQAWPSIELELTDANDKPVLRRVFGPADYLPAGTPPAAGFGARSEQAVRLHFALTDVKPSGYHLFVFYP